MTEPIIVTYSSLAKVRNCPRAYQYREIEEIVPIKFVSDPLTFGRLVHLGLEKWFQTGDKMQAIDAVNKELSCSEWGLHDPKSLQVLAILTGYIEYYSNDEWEVEAIEQEFRHPLPPHFEIRGKLDGVVLKDGIRYVMEHKTAQTVNYQYLNKLQMDFQALTYSYFYPLFSGKAVHGVCYDILGKPTIRQRKNETTDEYAKRLAEFYDDGGPFHREYLYFGKEEFRDYQAELNTTLTALWNSYEELRCCNPHAFPKNTQFCFSWNRSCPYLPLCKSLDNPGVKANYYKHEKAHSELSNSEEIPF